jgi:hypothetical protein
MQGSGDKDLATSRVLIRLEQGPRGMVMNLDAAVQADEALVERRQRFHVLPS